MGKASMTLFCPGFIETALAANESGNQANHLHPDVKEALYYAGKYAGATDPKLYTLNSDDILSLIRLDD